MKYLILAATLRISLCFVLMKGRLRGAHCSGACSWKEGEPGFQLWAVSITGKPDPFFPPILHTPRTRRSVGQWPQAVAVRLSRRQKPGLTSGLGGLLFLQAAQDFSITRRNGDSGNSSAPDPGGLEGGCLPPEGRGLCRPVQASDYHGQPPMWAGKDTARGVRGAASRALHQQSACDFGQVSSPL